MPPLKKKAKKSCESDDSNDAENDSNDESMDLVSNDGEENEISKSTPARALRPRKATKKPIVIDSEDEKESGDESDFELKKSDNEESDNIAVEVANSDSEEEEDYKPPKKVQKRSTNDNDTDDDHRKKDGSSQPKKRGRPKGSTKGVAQGKKAKAKAEPAIKNKKDETFPGFTKIKFRNFRESWLSDPHTIAAKAVLKNTKRESQDTFTQLLHHNEGKFQNLPTTNLKYWLSSRNISVDGFKSIHIEEEAVDEETPPIRLELPPFTGRVANKDCVALEDIELYLNVSSPIWHILFSPQSSLLKFADGTKLAEMNLVVGTSRIGWPVRTDDYEIRSLQLPELQPPVQSTSSSSSSSSGGVPQDVRIRPKEVFLLEDNRTTILVEGDTYFPSQKTFGIGNDYTRFVGIKEFHDNLLSIWSIHHQINKKNQSSSSAPNDYKVSYFIGLPQKGSILGMEWNKHISSNNVLIGMLAVAYGNGECDVLLVPQEASVHSSTSTSSSTSTASSYLSTPVIDVKDVCLTTLKVPNLLITSVSWNPVGMYELCCGMSDGSIVLFDVRESIFDHSKPPRQVKRYFDAYASAENPSANAVNAARISPTEPAKILSGGYDGITKIWDRCQSFSPIQTYDNCHAPIIEAQWEISGNGVYLSDTDSTQMSYEPLGSFPGRDRGVRCGLYQHNYRCGAIWKFTQFLQHDQPVVVSVASDGSVRGGFTSCLALSKEPLLTLFEMYRLVSLQPLFLTKLSTAQSSSSSSSPDHEETAILTINRQLKTKGFAVITNELNQNAELDLHAIDSTRIDDKVYGSQHNLIAFGGASGVVVVKATTFMDFEDYL